MKLFSLESTLSLSCLLLATMAVPGHSEGLAVSRQDIDIQGLGHNPEWQLEINRSGSKVNLTLEGTGYSYRYPETGPTLYRGETRTTIYHVPDDEHSLNIIVKGIECRDSETGKSYETTITVMLDGTGYRGCGDVLNR